MYKTLSKEDFPFSDGTPRTVWRITVPNALESADLEKVVRQAAEDAYQEQAATGRPPGAVRVFAYRKEDEPDNVPTAATGTLSVDGGWGKVADPAAGRNALIFKFEQADVYNMPTVSICSAGDLIDTGKAPVSLSTSSEDWSKIFHEVPPRTTVEVLEVKRFPLGGKDQMFRVKVKHGAVEGWAHSGDLAIGFQD